MPYIEAKLSIKLDEAQKDNLQTLYHQLFQNQNPIL